MAGLIDFPMIRKHLGKVVRHYEQDAPDVSGWADDLYIRMGEDWRGVTLGEIILAQNLFMDEVWMGPAWASNQVYKWQLDQGQEQRRLERQRLKEQQKVEQASTGCTCGGNPATFCSACSREQSGF